MAPKIGLALGAGSARGFAHLGVLKVLQEAEVPIHVISGTSMGSFIGAIYASGTNLDLFIKVLEHFKQKNYMDIAFSKWGLIKGNKIEQLIKLLTKNLTFEKLKVPLYIVAVDIENGEEFVFNEGPVYEAIRSSISIPGIFEPKRVKGKLFVDGAVLNCVPINVLKEHGVDIIIAVEVKYGGIIGKYKPINNIFDVIFHSIDLMQVKKIQEDTKMADVLIQPDLSHINPTNFENPQEAIKIGMKAARLALPKIKSLIENWEK